MLQGFNSINGAGAGRILPLRRCVDALRWFGIACPFAGWPMVKVIATAMPRAMLGLPQVLYIGQNEAELKPIAAQVEGLAIVAAQSVEQGLLQARQHRFDFVIFDQRDRNLASKHIALLVQNLGYSTKLVVVSQLGHLGAYLKVPGLAAVLAAPLRPQHVLRVLGIDQGANIQSLKLARAS